MGRVAATTISIPCLLFGQEHVVTSRISDVTSDADREIAALSRDALDVPLPMEIDFAGRGVQLLQLGELVGALILASGRPDRVYASLRGHRWGELGSVMWVSGLHAPCDELVSGLLACSAFRDACDGLDSGEWSVQLAEMVCRLQEDLVVAWMPDGRSMAARLESAARTMSAAGRREVTDAVRRSMAHHESEIRSAGGRVLSVAELEDVLAALTPSQFEFARTARLSAVLDLAVRKRARRRR